MNNDTSEKKKFWVRLTRLCNNRCLFCLDSDEQDGSLVPAHEALAELARGRSLGCDQAVLSGGEPTLHPQFFEIVSASRKMGYTWVQTITNGRMFSYAGFMGKAVAAGLDEITFSIHSDDPATFEALTRTSGSYNETMKGFMRAVKIQGLTVSVDIVLTRLNAGKLKQIIARLAGLGATEFDIIYPIPFGEAWPNRDRILFGAEERRSIIEAFEFCETRGIRIWANRIPASIFEGAERFIPRPGKLITEVAAKRDMFERMANASAPPPCLGDRCAYCHVRGFCRALRDFAQRVEAERPVSLRVSPQNVLRLKRPFPFAPDAIVLECPELLKNQTVQAFLKAGNTRAELIFASEPTGGFPRGLSRIYIEINRQTAESLLERGMPSDPDSDIKLLLRGKGTLEEVFEKDIRISDFVDAFKQRWGAPPPIVNVPSCLLETGEFDFLHAVPADVFRVNGEIDALKFAEWYAESGMFARGAACSGCVHRRTCPGLLINHVRAFGFSTIPGMALPGMKN